MNEWNLPITVEICGEEYKIRNDCDYRVILDVNSALCDDKETPEYNMHCAMYIFFENPELLPDPLTAQTAEEVAIIQECMDKITLILNCGEEQKKGEQNKPKIMDWEHDFKNMVAPINRVLGYSVRSEKNHTHWYDFISAYGEIGECYWSQVMNIRQKRAKGKALDTQEQAFYREHKDDINLPIEMSEEEKEWLDEDW